MVPVSLNEENEESESHSARRNGSDQKRGHSDNQKKMMFGCNFIKKNLWRSDILLTFAPAKQQ
jgi:hypothetical protein